MAKFFSEIADEKAQLISGGVVTISVSDVTEPVKGDRGTWSFTYDYVTAPSINASENTWDYYDNVVVSGKRKEVLDQYNTLKSQAG